MLNQYLNQETDRRFPPEKQREVIELAARLQEVNRDHLSAEELETLAAEVGLEPAFVREAIRKLSPNPKAELAKPVARPTIPSSGIWPEITVGLAMMLWGLLCAAVNPYAPGIPWLFVWAIALALGAGFTARMRGLALIYGAILGGTTMLSLHWVHGMEPHLAALVAYGLFGLAGYSLRQRFMPPSHTVPTQVPDATPDDRLERLERLRLLRAELESERTTRVFLSIDVVGSVQTKAKLGELEAERLFGLYQRWIASTVANFGGEVGSSAGDGAMAMFPNATSALRCAKALQAGMGAFNEQNGGNLRIRCGISEGAVPWKPGTTIGMIHSPVVDRAAVRQKQAPAGGIAVGEELLSEATYEFGSIQALPEANGERVFFGSVSAGG